MSSFFSSIFSSKTNNRRRNYNEEFNLNIRFIQNELESLIDLNNNELSIITVNKKISECLARVDQLLTNDYFNFMFINNMIVKDFTLKFIQKIIKSDYQKIFKFEAFRILESLIQWDIDQGENFCQNQMASEQYRNFFVAIVPELKSILIKTVVVPNLDTQNSESSTNWSMSSSSLNITDPKVLINLNKLICYLFTAVPLEQLIRIELVPKIFDYLFDQLVSPFILSQLMLSISRNLCELNSIKSEFIIEEEFKFNIHEKCVTRTVDLMEANVRNEKNRNLLKDSLSNYCNFIRTHLIELTGIEISELAAAMEIMTETDNLTIDQKWQKLLYRIVISIVRILRLEFDEGRVEIELIIYFYELLLENINSLTSSDAITISDKLMPVIQKINSWRETVYSQNGFTVDRNDQLKILSFKLADQFMHVLKSDFINLGHWESYESIWTKSIQEWYPMSFKMISTFCKSALNDLVCSIKLSKEFTFFFKYVQFLARIILNSWLDNESQHQNGGQCICGLKPKKNPKLFLSQDVLSSIIDLTHYYDHLIENDAYKHSMINNFLNDIYPLIKIVASLFFDLKSKKKLILFNNFFTQLFDLKSPGLKESKYWTSYLHLIMNKLELINQCSFAFEMDESIFETTLNLIQSITSFFPHENLKLYHETLHGVLCLINTESTINYSVANELNKFYNV